MSISINKIEELVSADMIVKATALLDHSAIVSIEQLGLHDYNAIVKGSTDYAVNIVLDKAKSLYTHRCDCPYNASPICKHKLAVILYIRQQLIKNEVIGEGPLILIDKKLKAYNREELHQLVLNIAKGSVMSREEIIKILD